MNRQNYEMVSGDTKLLIITVTDDSGEVVDVSSASVTYAIADLAWLWNGGDERTYAEFTVQYGGSGG